MRYWLTPILATLIMLAWTSPAQARMARVCSERAPAKTELACGKTNLHHATSVLRFLANHPNLGARFTRDILWRDFTWLKKYARYHISLAQSKMIPHRSLWNCLHNHEGSWYDRDSGHNGHYGGLQMSHNWLGILPGYAYNYTPLQQMTYAERGYRESGYSRDWLWGQWGQTLGYCTAYI